MTSKIAFYKERERLFNQLPVYHMKIPLGGFNEKLGRRIIFNPITDNEILHPENYNNNNNNNKPFKISQF